MHLRHPVHIRQSMILNRNVANTKFNFQMSYIFIMISFSDKPPAFLQVSLDELLLNPNSLVITEALNLLKTKAILPVALSIGTTTKSLCISPKVLFTFRDDR